MKLFQFYLSFPKDEDSAPRSRILSKECPEEFGAFKEVINLI
jgi:hypothetical protein